MANDERPRKQTRSKMLTARAKPWVVAWIDGQHGSRADWIERMAKAQRTAQKGAGEE